MFKAIENITSKIASFLYIRGHDKLAKPFNRLSWWAYDHCPSGYKGKM